MSKSFVVIPPPPPPPVRPATPPAVESRPVYLKANYQGKTVQTDLQPVSQEIYHWKALKSKVRKHSLYWLDIHHTTRPEMALDIIM